MNDLGHLKLGRRQVLKLGAAGFAAVLAGGTGSAVAGEAISAQGAGNSNGPDVFALGYWSGEPDTALVAAGSLSSGDASFAGRSALVEMLGMCPESGAATCQTLSSLAVDVDLEAAHGCVFHAWSLDNRSVLNVSRSSRFALPVDKREGLVLRLSCAAAGAPDERIGARVPLITGNRRGAAKLREGYYVIAPGEDEAAGLDWNRCRLSVEGDGPYLSRDGAPADFPFVALRVSPA